MKNLTYSETGKQRGAVLVVALVFLLILTTLAVTNMREVALDSRITSNMVDQRNLFNAAEAGLKDAEYRTIGTLIPIPGKYGPEAALRPLNAVSTCTNAVTAPCLLNMQPQYGQDFDTAGHFKSYSPDETTTFNESINWYALPAPGGASEGEAENPEYGNMLLGLGTFRYEVNSNAVRNDSETRLRGTVFRIYN